MARSTSSRAQSTSCGENVSIRPSSAASGPRSRGVMGRISMAPFEGDLYQPPRQSGVADPYLGGGLGEPGLRVQIAVRVDVDDERPPGCIQPEIDPPVVLAFERGEGSQRRVHHPLLQLRLERAALGGAVPEFVRA